MARIQIKRGTAAAWTAANPILSAGEWGTETDTGKTKLGDGFATWTALDYTLSSGDLGQANGVASLDSGGKVPSAQLPSSGAVASVAGRTGDVVLSAADVSGVVASGGALGTPSSGDVWACVGQVADMSIVGFGATTTRATGTGDFPFGVRLQRAITFTSVTYRAATADASGNLVVELRRNGVAVTGSSSTIAAASQVAGGTATGTWAFASGDIITVQVTGIGTTPGRGLIADIRGLTT